VGDDFSLPFHPQEIIPADSPFEIYRRTIANAETYMKRGDFLTARSLYEGVLDRVSDASMRKKLEDNLEYLNNYHQVVARQQELRRQKKDQKPQEVRLILEGGDNIGDRLQIGLSSDKQNLDMEELADKVSEKLGGFSPDGAKAVEKYRNELSQVRSQLREMSRLKEQVQRLNEDQLKREEGDIDQLRKELSELREETASPIDREKEILSEIERREEENRLLRDRLDLIQKEMSLIKDDNRRTSALEEALSTTIQRQNKGGTSEDTIDLMRDEISNLKQSLDSITRNAGAPAPFGGSAQSMGDIASAMKESMETLTPLLNEALKNKNDPASKNDENKKDDFQLIEDIMHGPKFDEPTDEEVLAKVLKDAMSEHAKKNKPKKDESAEADQLKNAAEKKKETPPDKHQDLKDDFELVSDYIKGDEGSMPTDDEVMEKILRDAMKTKDFRGSAGGQLTSGGVFSQDSSRGMQPPVRKKKELPILRVSYNFSRLPDEFTLSIDKNHLEYSFYKFKPMLEKASDLVKRRKVKDAINYYRVVMDQEIPVEFKDMLNQNINDLNEYLTKYYTSE
jgi:hypothetical protein